MKKRTISFGLTLLAFSSAATATTVQLGVQNPIVTMNTQVSEAAYRLKQGGWDQMLSNGATSPGASDMVTVDYSGATALNDTTWDFTIFYESGDNGLQGFTFEMIQVGGPRQGTLVYNLGNPINGLTPNGPFNAIEIEGRAAELLNPTQYNEEAEIKITDLAFNSSLPSSGIFENPLDAYTPSPGSSEDIDSTWILSTTDLSLVDWTLTGKVNAIFDCNGMDSAGCLQDDSLKMTLRIAEVSAGSSVIPLPAAVWLFGSALASCGFLRRNQTV